MIANSLIAFQLSLTILLGTTFPSFAQTVNSSLSNTEKCDVYKAAFEKVLNAAISHSLSDSFRNENIAFIKSGCIEYGYVCPRSLADLAAANELTLATMNKGLASTFVPFKCPKAQ